MNDIVLPSDRLVLRPFKASDAPEALAAITPTLTRYLSWEPPASAAAFQAIWHAWLDNMAQGNEFVFVVRRRDDDTFLGLAGLHRVRGDHPELGIWITESQHGHRYGREAVGTVLGWARSQVSADHFVYPVAEANHASRRIAEALGGTVVERVLKPKYPAVVYRIAAVAANP